MYLPCIIQMNEFFNRFLNCCGSQLTHLRLSACEFLNKDLVDTIANVCSDLIGMSFAILCTSVCSSIVLPCFNIC